MYTVPYTQEGTLWFDVYLSAKNRTIGLLVTVGEVERWYKLVDDYYKNTPEAKFMNMYQEKESAYWGHYDSEESRATGN